MAATIFSNASAVKPGMKVEITQPIPHRVVQDRSSWSFITPDGSLYRFTVDSRPEIGVFGRVHDVRTGWVIIEVDTPSIPSTIGVLVAVKDFVFEKYFGERL